MEFPNSPILELKKMQTRYALIGVSIHLMDVVHSESTHDIFWFKNNFTLILLLLNL